MPAKKKENNRAYFRRVFTEHPEWLALPDNTLPAERWQNDHGGAEPTEQVRQSLASLKSTLRIEQGIATRGPHRQAGAVELKKLEDMIFACLDQARSISGTDLAAVVRHLRKALAHAVLAGGEGE